LPRNCGTSFAKLAITRAPGDTPPEIIDKLNKEINAGLADAKMKARFAEAGGYTPWVSSPAELRKFILNDVEKWRKVIRAANISAL